MRAVLSIGSNLGDRLARLQSVVDAFGSAVCAVSGVYETEAWGGVDQGRFLNAVLSVDDPGCDGHAWLHRSLDLEQAAGRVRRQRWGPRTLDVDVISCYDKADDGGEAEVVCRDEVLTLPHPLAHLRAFVLVPWQQIEPLGRLTVAGRSRPVAELLVELDPAELAGTRLTELVLRSSGRVER